MTRRNELEAQLRAAPLDEATYLIYADLLQSEGDPRGELIMLDEGARGAPPEEQATWRRRRAELLARHPELAPSVDGVHLTWHLGFVRTVTFKGRFPEELARDFLAHAALAFATTIELDNWSPPFSPRLIELFASAPSTISRLVFGPRTGWSGWRGVIELDPILALLPRVDDVSSAFEFELTRGDRLHSLSLGTSPATLARIASVELPALERLSLDLAQRHAQFSFDTEPLDLAELAPLFEAPPPALAHLALLHPPDGDALIAALATSRVLPQLRTLRIWNAGLTTGGARVITREAFGHLQQLDLSDAGLDPATVRLVEGVCPDVRTIPLRFTAGSGR